MSEESKLEDLTKLVLFFGRVSEVHLNNLRSYPFIFFNDVSEAKLDYGIATTKEEESIISYDLSISKENDNLDKRYRALESAIRSLFWKEMKVKISINGGEVYRSE